MGDFLVPRNGWVGEGDGCARCGRRFGSATARANCPCCGKLCCADCVRAECTIVSGTPPSRVCIDCFSMLQSYKPTGPGKSLPRRDSANVITSSTARATVEAERGRSEETAATAASSSSSRPSSNHGKKEETSLVYREYMEDILRKSELLRKENDTLLKHLAEQEVRIHDLRGERDLGFAHSAASGAKYSGGSKNEVQQGNDEHVKELRIKLDVAHRRIRSVEEELEKALDSAKRNEATVKHLQERLSRFEEDSVGLVRSQCNTEFTSENVRKGSLLANRYLPTSLVQDTILTVVPPKPCTLSAADINLQEWEFDTFEVASRVPSVLQTVAVNVAKAWGLFPDSGDAQKWNMMAAAMENNYRPNPYHNAVHAADVLQGCFALVTTAQPLMKHVTPLELKALAFSAMAHDVRHPGRTNAFLMAIHDPVSFKFCGNGILEQLHTATAFQLLNVPEFDFTSSLDNTSFMEFKNIVTRLISHTDMSIHNESVAWWGKKAGSGGFDCTSKADRLEALALILHASDIGASSRSMKIAKKWLVVLDEFAEQAEDERRRGLPVTPGFDYPSCVERSQIAFLDFVVIPTFDLLNQLFPDIKEPLCNLRKLREIYAAKSGDKRPFPSPVDYRTSNQRAKDLEALVSEYRKREEDFYRHVEDIKAAGERIKKKSVTLKIKEKELNGQLKLVLQREECLKADLARAKVILERGEAVKNMLNVHRNSHLLGGETTDTHTDDDSSIQLDLQRGEFESTGSRKGGSMREREATAAGLMMSPKFRDSREKKLVFLSEKLSEIADMLQEERKQVLQREEQESTQFSRGSTRATEEDTSVDKDSLSLAHREAEKRLAKKYNEVDELLLIVRAMRTESASRRDTGVRNSALSATLAEREAAIAEAVELSRRRRRRVEVRREYRPSPGQLDRLENAIFQLTAAVTLLTDR